MPYGAPAFLVKHRWGMRGSTSTPSPAATPAEGLMILSAIRCHQEFPQKHANSSPSKNAHAGAKHGSLAATALAAPLPAGRRGFTDPPVALVVGLSGPNFYFDHTETVVAMVVAIL
jgi:hypothetical protein